MSWIKMRAGLFTHPKVVRMASALEADTLRTVGGLMSVWCLFDAHSVDGVLDGYTAEVLDDYLRWPGFSAAMEAVEWLEDGGESLSLPRFDTHNGTSAKRRAQDADRKRAARKASASQADKKRTREEKIREEDKNPPNPPAGGGRGRSEGPAQNPEPYPAEFEAAWAAYPRRSGGNSKKAAFDAWRARVRAGADPADLLSGASRYAEFVRGEGKEGSRFVMMAATFFGPGEHYAEPWQAESDEGAGFDWGDAL